MLFLRMPYPPWLRPSPLLGVPVVTHRHPCRSRPTHALASLPRMHPSLSPARCDPARRDPPTSLPLMAVEKSRCAYDMRTENRVFTKDSATTAKAKAQAIHLSPPAYKHARRYDGWVTSHRTSAEAKAQAIHRSPPCMHACMHAWVPSGTSGIVTGCHRGAAAAAAARQIML